MLLGIVSSTAAAEWVEVDRTDTTTVYGDPTSVRRAGDMVKMWEITDFATAKKWIDGKLYMSTRERSEYDCKEERWRTLHISLFSGHMSYGEVVFSVSSPGDWKPVAPDTIAETYWKLVCKR
jgi:hypothetical protein